MSRARARAGTRATARQRQRGLVRGVLLFLAGLLAGANLLYFMVVRHAGAPDVRPPPPAPAGTASSVKPQSATTAHPPSNSSARVATPSPPITAADARAGVAATPVPVMPAAGPRSTAIQITSATPLLIPVRGVLAPQLQDTFGDARAQGRSHEAIDIMAPAGTPVLAVADGTVEKLFTSVAGGLTVYQFEPGGRYAYYYAHLQAYAPGLAEKQALRRGDVIGYVGSTGNADPAAPHLHFAVFELGPERRWWQGTAINPYPLLRRQ